jgi:hypothetical protein
MLPRIESGSKSKPTTPTTMTDASKLPNEDELERLLEEEEPVYSVVWDSGNPGAGAGAERVYRWKGGYLAVTDDGERDAVYPTLRNAIEGAELNRVTEATVEISSSDLTSEEIAAMLSTFDEGRYQVRIHGEKWATDGSGGFRRA